MILFQSNHQLQLDFNTVQKWFSNNGLILNKSKSYSMLFSTRSARHNHGNNLTIKFSDGTLMENVEELKYLGLWLDSSLSFRPHIDSIVKRVNYNLRLLYRSINCFTQLIRLRIVTQLLFPIIDYCYVLRGYVVLLLLFCFHFLRYHLSGRCYWLSVIIGTWNGMGVLIKD